MEKPEGYPEIVESNDDMPFLETGTSDYHYIFESKFGKKLDPRLVAVVDFFRELYFRKKELFKKMFSGLHLIEVLKKSGLVLWRVKSSNRSNRFVTMQRSLSLGSPRSPAGAQGIEELRNEWIKVRTINFDGGGGGQQGSDAGCPKSGKGSK